MCLDTYTKLTQNLSCLKSWSKKNKIQKDVFRFIEKGCISAMDNLITWNFQNEFGLELQIMHSFR
jgi:hypothetical protein